MKNKEHNKIREELNKAIMSVMGFDKYDVISLTKEEFIKEKLPVIKLIISTSNVGEMIHGFEKLRKD